MSGDTPKTNEAGTLGTTGGVLEATTHNIGKKIVETLRKRFTGNGKVQCGDLYLHRSRILLQNNSQLMHPNDRIAAQEQFTM